MAVLHEQAMKLQKICEASSAVVLLLRLRRPGYGCKATLLKDIEDWKRALDDNKYVAAVLMELPEAFDCLPHDLLLLKLKTCGLSENIVQNFNRDSTGEDIELLAKLFPFWGCKAVELIAASLQRRRKFRSVLQSCSVVGRRGCACRYCINSGCTMTPLATTFVYLLIIVSVFTRWCPFM